MAQTRKATRGKILALAAVDALGRPAAAVASAFRHVRPGPLRNVLVVEPWGLGDLVLTTPLLRTLRERLPETRISLLGRPVARTLLEHSGLVDNVIVADLPWTAPSRKYALSRYDGPALRALLRELRALRFDVTLDARRDLRSNFLAYLAGAPRRIGYDSGGGAYLLTHALPSGAQEAHKIDDWMRLLEPLLGEVPPAPPPLLRVTEQERAAARSVLAAAGIRQGRTLVAVHPGASHPVRRWDQARVRNVTDALLASGAEVVLIREPGSAGDALLLPPGVRAVQPGLRMLMAITALCDLFVCNDSGPMHIAAALGTPVTAIFGPQKAEWFGPRGAQDRVVHIPEMPCRPCFDVCIHPEPYCMTRIESAAIVRAALEQLRLAGAPVSALSLPDTHS